MGALQHNKFIVVGGKVKQAICGSTNFSWRGFFVQANSAVTLTGPTAVAAFQDAFEAYWASDAVADFGVTPSATWRDLGLAGVAAKVAFSPHAAGNATALAIDPAALTVRYTADAATSTYGSAPGPFTGSVSASAPGSSLGSTSPDVAR